MTEEIKYYTIDEEGNVYFTKAYLDLLWQAILITAEKQAKKEVVIYDSQEKPSK